MRMMLSQEAMSTNKKENEFCFLFTISPRMTFKTKTITGGIQL